MLHRRYKDEIHHLKSENKQLQHELETLYSTLAQLNTTMERMIDYLLLPENNKS